MTRASLHSVEASKLRISLTSIMVFLAVIFFSGAYVEQWIFGAGFDRNISFVDRILNTSKFIPVYLFFIVRLMNQPKAFQMNLYSQLPIFVFCFYYILSSAWSMDYVFSFINSMIFLCTVLTAWGIASTVSYERFIKAAFYALMVIAVGSIVYIIFLPSYGLMKGVDQETYTNLAGLPQGVFKHKSRLAEIMSIAFIFALFSKGYIRQSHRLILATLSLYLLLSTEASLKTVGLFASIAVMVIWEFSVRAFGQRLVSSVMVSIAFLIPAMVFMVFMQAIILASGEDMTLTGRTIIWEHAYKIAMRSPLFGFGPSSIWNTPLGHVDQLPLFRIPHAHNTFLELLLQTGITGMGLIFWFLSISIGLILYGRNEINSRSKIAFLVVWSGIARSTFEFGLFQGNNLSFLFMLIVISHQALQKAGRNQRKAAPRDVSRHPQQSQARVY
jgi:exopolysaccharide production protein ExoQ